ncbi:hypothetical protein IJ425_00335 [bacterium]|nr:hypothetical protein [bacterium]
MGLAASQARFLGLTARKSNVEYQVQQINQQRVALSNEVMGLYQEYNRLEVPTPPIVQDFQQTTYTLDSTQEGYTIENFTRIPSGEYEGYYDVALAWNEEVARAYNYTAKDSIITKETDDEGISKLTFQFGINSFYYDKNDTENSTVQRITQEDGYENYQGLTNIMKEKNYAEGTVFYGFLKDGTYYYTTEQELMEDVAFETVDNKERYYGDYTFDYQGLQTVPNNTTVKAALTQESSGRLSTIQVLDSPDDESLKDKTFSITTSQKDDQLAYEDAMNQYYYDKAQYEREVEKINMKTEEIQEQDRALELQIGQLDTEQNALSTEMDSVKKVIEDTMEKVFKTFSS